MGRFDRTLSGQIERKVEDATFLPKIGRVVEVYEHLREDDYVNFEVDVKILGEDIQHRAIPYQFRATNDVTVPVAGDKVLVEYRDGEKKQAIARGAVFTNETRPPTGRSGEWKRRIPSTEVVPGVAGDLYVESYSKYDVDPSMTDPSDEEPVEGYVRLAKKETDEQYEDLPASIEISDDEEEQTTRVKAETNQDEGSMSFELDMGLQRARLTADPEEIDHTIDRPDKLEADTESERTEMKMELDMMEGTLTLSGFAGLMGLKFNLNDGTFRMLDADGYGIASEGQGDFVWHNASVTHNSDPFEEEL